MLLEVPKENTSLPGEGSLILWPLGIFLLATFLSLFNSFTLTLLLWRLLSEVIHRQKVHSFVESIVVKSTCNNDDQYKLKIKQSHSGSLLYHFFIQLEKRLKTVLFPYKDLFPLTSIVATM